MKRTLRTLAGLARAQGVELWLVGGFVRDALLGRPAPDADLVLRGAVPFARQAARTLHGAFVLLDDEWGTARVVIKRGRSEALELDFAELRGANLMEDLAHRDFSINAIAGALPEFLQEGAPALTDPLHGVADLEAGLIRAGSQEVLQADPLRALRAYRFAAQLGFTIVPQTRSWIHAVAPRLDEVAAERITAELLKLLSAPRCAPHFRELAQERILAAVLAGVPWDGLALATSAVAHLEEWLAEPAAFPAEAAPVLEWLQEGARQALLKWAVLWDGLVAPAERSAIAAQLRFSREQQRLWGLWAAFRSSPRAVLGGALSGLPEGPARALLCRYFRRTGAEGRGGILGQWAHLRTGCKGPAAARLTTAAAAALRLYDGELEPILQRPRLLTGRDLRSVLHLSPGPCFKSLLTALLQAELMGQVTTREEALDWVRQRVEAKRAQTARIP